MDKATRERLRAQAAERKRLKDDLIHEPAVVTLQTQKGVLEVSKDYLDATIPIAAVIEKPKKRPKRPIGVNANDCAMRRKGRLPHGSRFEVEYDAGTQTWSGSLRIKGPSQDKPLEDSADALFKLLQKLDDQYRAYLAKTMETAQNV